MRTAFRRRGSALTAVLAALMSVLLVLVAAPADAAGYKQMRNREVPWFSNGVCLDIDQGKYAAGAQAGVEWCDQQTAQQLWMLVEPGSIYPYKQLRVSHTGMCLTVRAGSYADDAAVEQQPCAVDDPATAWVEIPPQQQWKFVYVPNTSYWYEVVARHSNKCLTNAGWNAWQDNCDGSTRQHWSLPW
jgi:hypothetical protein